MVYRYILIKLHSYMCIMLAYMLQAHLCIVEKLLDMPPEDSDIRINRFTEEFSQVCTQHRRANYYEFSPVQFLIGDVLTCSGNCCWSNLRTKLNE